MEIDSKQKFDIPLVAIVPEYYSKNPVVQWLFNKRLKVALSFLKMTQVDNFIDVGCGDGSFIKLALAHQPTFKEIWGVDLNPSVTRLKEQFPSVHFEVQNLLQMTIPAERFSSIVSLDTLEHIENLSVAVGEFKRILKPGGYVITSEPVESRLYKTMRFILKGTYSQESGPGAGVHYYNAHGVDKAIQAGGFKRVKQIKLPVPAPFDLFHITVYQKI